MKGVSKVHTATLLHCCGALCFLHLSKDTGYFNLQTDQFFPIPHEIGFYPCFLWINEETETQTNEVALSCRNLELKETFQITESSLLILQVRRHRRLSGMSKVTRLLSGIDGTWTQAFKLLVKCSFHDNPTPCIALARKSATEVKHTTWSLEIPSVHHHHLLSIYYVQTRELNTLL